MAKKPMSKKSASDKLDAAMVVRNNAMNNLAAVVTAIWGPRCDRNQAACPCCAVWTVYDAMEQLTDIGTFENITVEDAIKIIERAERK